MNRRSSSPPPVLQTLGVSLIVTVLGIGLVSWIIDGFSSAPLLHLIQDVALLGLGVSIVIGAVGLVAVRLGGWGEPDEDFDRRVERSEQMARRREPEPDTFEFGVAGDRDEGPRGFADDRDGVEALEVAAEDERFDALVRAAINELPFEFHRALEHVAIVISDSGSVAIRGRDGRRRGAYGMYQGDTIAHDFFTERILIFRDTLLRDFGHDPEMLRLQVRRVLRHELAHHLGWGERGVRHLGL
jgi:predicted Zn-dependent protease with MMP-like domain